MDYMSEIMTPEGNQMTPEGDQMTHKGDQMTPEGNHCGMISRHRLMPLSPARYTEYYVHTG
jgi:hypothetical protein